VNILNSLTVRSLKLNRRRTIVTIIGIILSGAMICGVTTIAASFQDLFIQSAIASDGNYHATFKSVSLDNVKYITDNPYTRTSMLSRDLGYAGIDRSIDVNKPYLFIREYDSTALQAMPLELTQGRLPEKAGEIVLVEEVAQAGGAAYQVGQTLELTVGTRVDAAGTVLTQQEPYSETESLRPLFARTYTITGYITIPGFESSLTPGFRAIAYLDAGTLAAADSVDVSILGKNIRQIFQKAPEIAANAGAAAIKYNNELLKWSGVSGNDDVNRFMKNLTLIIILLVMVGSVTVIYNAFAISVSERKKQFGMLASVGATPQQIRRTVFYEGFVLGLIGIPLGILSGIVGIGVTLRFVNRLLLNSVFTVVSDEVALRLIVSPVTIGATVLFVSLIILLSAYLPARIAARISPIDAIRLSTDIKIRGKSVRTSWLTRRVFGIEGDLALKNLRRNRRRYRATVFSLVISIVLFVTFSSFMTYGFNSSNMYYGKVPYNVMVQKYGATAAEREELYAQITALAGVERYAVVRELYGYADGLDLSRFGPFVRKNFVDKGIYVPDATGKFSAGFNIVTPGPAEFKAYAEANGLNLADYSDPENLRGILVNKIVLDGRIEYEPMAMTAGEILHLAEPKLDDAHIPAEYDLEIGAVTDNYPFGVSSGGTSSVLVVSEPVFAALQQTYRTESQASDPYLYIQAQDSAALTAAIRQLGGNSDRSLYVEDIAAVQERAGRFQTVIAIFLYGFVTLITLVGVTNIFNTVSTNIALRRREFAMLRSVGLTPAGFSKMINFESIFYGLKALVYGLPLSCLISVWMYNSFGNLFEFAFVLPWREILICIAGVFAVVSVTMLHASARFKQENIIDALREENL